MAHVTQLLIDAGELTDMPYWPEQSPYAGGPPPPPPPEDAPAAVGNLIEALQQIADVPVADHLIAGPVVEMAAAAAV